MVLLEYERRKEEETLMKTTRETSGDGQVHFLDGCDFFSCSSSVYSDILMICSTAINLKCTA